MKKITALLLSLIIFVFAAAGCEAHTSKAFTFSVENGDNIKLDLDTTGGYNISSKLPFAISYKDEEISHGTFIFGEVYSEYVNAAETDEKATILDSGTKDGNEYVFWNYDNKEFNYVIYVHGSNTALLIGNNVSEESARECFNRLTITAE